MGKDSEAVIRSRFDLSYDGTLFHGWAAQRGLRTVEGVLSEAVAQVVREPVRFTVAGRTDAGVHAEGQVAHVDLGQEIAPAQVRRINTLLASDYSRVVGRVVGAGYLPKGAAFKGQSDVLLRSVTAVGENFDARFSAEKRKYRYSLVADQRQWDPLTRNRVWWVHSRTLDVEVMSSAAQQVLGEHDFLSFCRPREGATTVRTLENIVVSGRQEIAIEVEGDAFCHSMVRSLVGALVEVGRGARPVEWLTDLVEQPSRQGSAPVAPAHGLTLVGVDYPPAQFWAEQAQKARTVREVSGTIPPGL